MDLGNESGQHKWRALRHFAWDKVADEELLERSSLNLWDNRIELLGKKVGDFWNNVGGCGWMGRAPTRSENLRERDQGIIFSVHEQARRQSEENWEQHGATVVLRHR